MPLYEFQCEKCGHRFERMQGFNDPAPEKCPDCGQGPIKQLISAPGVQFKGSGWYVNDYGKGGGNSGASGKKKESSSETKSSDSSSTSSSSGSGESK